MSTNFERKRNHQTAWLKGDSNLPAPELASSQTKTMSQSVTLTGPQISLNVTIRKNVLSNKKVQNVLLLYHMCYIEKKIEKFEMIYFKLF